MESERFLQKRMCDGRTSSEEVRRFFLGFFCMVSRLWGLNNSRLFPPRCFWSIFFNGKHWNFIGFFLGLEWKKVWKRHSQFLSDCENTFDILRNKSSVRNRCQRVPKQRGWENLHQKTSIHRFWMETMVHCPVCREWFWMVADRRWKYGFKILHNAWKKLANRNAYWLMPMSSYVLTELVRKGVRLGGNRHRPSWCTLDVRIFEFSITFICFFRALLLSVF